MAAIHSQYQYLWDHLAISREISLMVLEDI
jgi:hypothetical protein